MLEVVCFRSSKVHRSMSAKSAIEKLEIIAKEKDAQKSEDKCRQEEAKMLRKKKQKKRRR